MKVFFSIVIIAFATLTTANGQKANKAPARTFTYAQLQAYRQSFSDDLPKPVGYTNDYEHLFTDEQRYSLDSVMDDFRSKTSIQMCLVTFDTMLVANDKFDDMALHIANAWGVGEKGKNNGITICVSAGYRKIKVCNGNGIVEILSNNETAEIINTKIVPAINNGGYYGAILVGLNAIMEKINSRTPH